MSEIIFDANLNTDRLEAAVKESKKTIKDWVKDIEKSGQDMDQSFAKTSKNIKETIAQQKALVKELEADIKKLEKAYKSATPGEEMRQATNKLAKEKAYLAQEQQRLLDLQQEQIIANQKEEESTNSIISVLGKSALAFISVGAVIKTFKSIIESTEATSLAFHATLNGLKSSLDYFMKSVASADFSNFIDGIRNAYRAGRDYAREMDEIQNLQREYMIKETDLNRQIEEQRRVLYEDDKTSNNAKIEAGDRMLDYTRQKADLEIDLATKTYNALADLENKKNKMQEDDIKYIIENYTRVNEIGSAYNKLNKIVEEYNKRVKQGFADESGAVYVDPFNTGAFKLSRTDIDKIKAQQAALGPDAEKLGGLLKSFERLTGKERQVIADAINDIKQAENQYLIESKRVFRMKENLIDQEAKKEQELADAIKTIQNEIAIMKESGMDRELKELELKYQKDLELFKDNEEIKVLLTERYALEQEAIRLKYLEKDKAENEKFRIALEKINPGKGFSLMNKALINAGIKPVSNIGALRGTNQTQQEIEKQVNENLEKQIELRKQIVAEAANLVTVLGEVIGLDESEMEKLNGLLVSLTRLSSGDLVGAVSSMLTTILSQIDVADSFSDKVERINKLIDRQNELISQSQRLGGTEQLLKERINLLYQQLEIAENQLKKAEKSQDRWIQWFAATNGEIQTMKENIDALKREILKAEQDLSDFLSGNITQETIADIIADGFQSGKTSVDDFADYMNEALTTAVLEVFKTNILGDAMTELQKYISQALSDKILTVEEKQAIDQRIKALADSNKELWDNLTQGLDMGIGTPEGLAGGIRRQITEETGSELAGLFRRFADDERQIRDFSKQGIMHLASIEANTYGTMVECQRYLHYLEDINKNTHPVYSGDL